MNNPYNPYQNSHFFSDPFDGYNPFYDEFDFNSRVDSMQTQKDNYSSVEMDYGPEPFVIDINKATLANNNFRTALWTGKHLQVTLMSINVGDNIGFEIHNNLDQFIRIEEGQGIVKMGKNKNRPDFQANVYDDSIIIIPAGTWHNIINTGNSPLKLYSIYAPPQHPEGTVHVTKADAEAAEMQHS